MTAPLPDRVVHETRATVDVAVHTPTGRDGPLTVGVLERWGLTTRLCADVDGLCAAITNDFGALLIAEEALRRGTRERLFAALTAQPSWSDIPLIVLTGTGELSRSITEGIHELMARGSAVLLERPVRIATLITAVRSALRARLRQFEIRDYVTQCARAEAAVRVLNETLDRRVIERTAERDALRRALVEAEEAERRRLARELHDQLGQELTAFRLGLDDAARLAAAHDSALAAPDAPLVRRLAGLQTLAAHMTLATRILALELRPPELDDVGLEHALATYAQEWAARYEMVAEVAVTGLSDGRTVPPEAAIALYRITQEALTNVAKHAQATQVSIIVDRSYGAVLLIIEDDGQGFDVDANEARAKVERRLGLSGMQERAALVGGTVNVESSPGSGTTLYVRLPLAETSLHDRSPGVSAADEVGASNTVHS